MPSAMATKRNSSAYLDEMKKVTPSRQKVVDAIAQARRDAIAKARKKRQDNKGSPQESSSENLRPGLIAGKKMSSLDPEPSTGEVDSRSPLYPVRQSTSPSKTFLQNVFASRSEAQPPNVQTRVDMEEKSGSFREEGRNPSMDSDKKEVADPPADGWSEEAVRENAPSHSAESLDVAEGPKEDKKEDGATHFSETPGPSEAFPAKKNWLQSVAETEECEFGLSSRNLPNSPSMKDDIDLGYDSWELKGMASEETMVATGNSRRTRPHKGTFVRKGKKKGNQEGKVIMSLFSVDSSVAPVDALFDQDCFDEYDDEEDSDEEEFERDDSEEYSVSKPMEVDIPLERKESTSRNDIVVFHEGEDVEMLETTGIQDEVESALGKDEKIEYSVKKKLQESKPKKTKTKDNAINIKINTNSSGLDPAGVTQHSLLAENKKKEKTVQPDPDGAAENYDDFVQDFLQSGSIDESGTAANETETIESTTITCETDASVDQNDNENSNETEKDCAGEPEEEKGFLEHFAALGVEEKEAEEAEEVKATENKNEDAKSGSVAMEEQEEEAKAVDDSDLLLPSSPNTTEEKQDDEAEPKNEAPADDSPEEREHSGEPNELKTDSSCDLEQPSDEDSKMGEQDASESADDSNEEKDSKETNGENESVENEQKESTKTAETTVEESTPEPIKIFTFERGISRKTWRRRKEMATEWQSNKTWLSPKTLNGVSAVKNLVGFTNKEPDPRPWKLPYKERTRNHPGYKDIDKYSVRESTEISISIEPKDDLIPWERRDVKQLFLQERSVEFSRNWFGKNLRQRGNERYKAPICKPKSMEMPISNAPDPGQWTEDVYTTWKSPYQKFEQQHLTITKTEDKKSEAGKANGNKIKVDAGSFSDGSSYSDDRSFTESEGSYDDEEGSYTGSEGSGSFSHADDGTEGSWEDAPECGEIINMRLKIGEHITRVHPDFTSSLRRSRWRKKYFPNGTFPY